MRNIKAEDISKMVARLCLKANIFIRPDVLAALNKSLKQAGNQRARNSLKAIISNAAIAAKERLAVCQDTGFPAVFVWMGSGVRIDGDLNAAINEGIVLGYKQGYFRNSVVDPLKRSKPGYYPAVIHTEITRGNRLKIAFLAKGFGSENKTSLKMLNPTSGAKAVRDFAVDAVRSAGPDACPPYIVGVGIGGTAETACLMAKKALLKPLKPGKAGSLEKEIYDGINRLGIGPMGFGGKITCLGVNILTHPTHIAGLPVCVSINCHALRSATGTL